MGYAGKLAEKRKAQQLRRKGYSYSEILREIRVSKDTISRWCRDIPLTERQKLRLYKKKTASGIRGCYLGAKKLQQRRIEETRNLLAKGKQDVGELTKRERFLIGIGLYAADGSKGDGRVAFSNSDPRMIRFMVNWFREFCEVSGEKIKGALWIHDDQDVAKAQKYWSGLTEIPLDRFTKPYIAKNKPSSRKIRKKRHPYGVFTARFGSATVHRRLMGWIEGALKGTQLDFDPNLE